MAARQVAIERDELRLMPDLEEKELALILEAKGLTPDNARESAEAMMRDPTARARNQGAGGARHSAAVRDAARRRPRDRHGDGRSAR